MTFVQVDIGVHTADAEDVAVQFSSGDLVLTFVDWQESLRRDGQAHPPRRGLGMMNGIWHGFYGQPRAPLFPERTALEYRLPTRSYPQQRSGWFREIQKVAAAIVSVRDGVVLFENPWGSQPLNRAQRDELLRLSELRPEFSWFGPNVGIEVEAVLARMVVLAELNGEEASA